MMFRSLLLTILAQTFPYAPTTVISPEVQAGAEFGIDVKIADFNGDGKSDLAVGARKHVVNSVVEHGKVFVFYGNDYVSAVGVLPNPTFDFRAQFGSVVESADFDNDGFDDLVVSSPVATVQGLLNAGAVHVFFGPQFSRQIELLPFNLEANNFFGSPLHVGDANADGYADVVVSASGQDWGPGSANYGTVVVYYGPDFRVRRQVFSTTPQPGTFYGSNMRLYDANGDTLGDLAIGASSETSGAVTDAGNVYFALFPFVSSTKINYPTPVQTGRFGRDIAFGDFDNDGDVEIVVAAYRETVEDGPDPNSDPDIDAGAIYVFQPPTYTSYQRILRQDREGKEAYGMGDTGDEYGVFLSANDIDGDGYDDLVVGVEFSNFNGASEIDAGSFIWYSGGLGGLSPTRFDEIYEPTPEGGAIFAISGDTAPFDAGGSFQSPIYVAIGCQRGTVSGNNDAGRVLIYR